MKRHWVRLQLRFEAPKDAKFEMLSHRVALSGCTWLATLSFKAALLRSAELTVINTSEWGDGVAFGRICVFVQWRIGGGAFGVGPLAWHTLTFFTKKSTGTVHARLVRSLLLQAHWLYNNIPEYIRTRHCHSEYWKIFRRVRERERGNPCRTQVVTFLRHSVVRVPAHVDVYGAAGLYCRQFDWQTNMAVASLTNEFTSVAHCTSVSSR